MLSTGVAWRMWLARVQHGCWLCRADAFEFLVPHGIACCGSLPRYRRRSTECGIGRPLTSVYLCIVLCVFAVAQDGLERVCHAPFSLVVPHACPPGSKPAASARGSAAVPPVSAAGADGDVSMNGAAASQAGSAVQASTASGKAVKQAPVVNAGSCFFVLPCCLIGRVGGCRGRDKAADGTRDACSAHYTSALSGCMSAASSAL
jgi:hypothetical protein